MCTVLKKNDETKIHLDEDMTNVNPSHAITTGALYVPYQKNKLNILHTTIPTYTYTYKIISYSQHSTIDIYKNHTKI